MEGIEVLRCGIVDYQVMSDWMKDLQRRRIADEIDDTLILSLIHI